jgi:hypothetical protein
MVRRFLVSLSLFAAVAAPAFAQPVSTEALRRHVDMLASDAFEGREPGTPGEEKTIAYISRRLASLGLEPAAAGASWYQPVGLVTRRPEEQSVSFRGKRKRDRLSLDRDDLLLIGREARQRVEGARVVFAGHGAVAPDKGIDQLGDSDLAGAVVLILYQGPRDEGFPDFQERVKIVADRGAAAVIGIVGERPDWPSIQRFYDSGQKRLALDPPPVLAGLMRQGAAERLFRLGRGDLGMALNSNPVSFTPAPLELKADLDIATRIDTMVTNNVVGRLRGSASDGRSLLYLGHWDHLGICEPESPTDRICNGAVDNASGIAVLLEVAAALARGPRPKRDIFFLATTAEEMGLLGAEHFARRPPLPLDSLVAAINLDTVAIGGRGEKVAVMGRGVPELDAIIDRTIAEAERTLDPDDEAAAFVQRQDGWALTQAGVPAIMVGGSFSDMAKLQAFLRTAYHSAADNPGPAVPLDGAAEDADLMIALGRKLADPRQYPAARSPKP